MTRKSRPRTTRLNLTLALACCSALWSQPGCAVFSAKESGLSDYDLARESIDNPEGIYRPEGVSAEKDFGSKAILEKFGLRAKRRKDIELAREYFAKGQASFEAAKALEGKARMEGFREAAEQYVLAGENWRSSGLEQDALLMAAEARFFAEDYYRAENLYAQIIKEYPRNAYIDHIEARRFEIADYWLNFDAAKKTPFAVVNFTDGRLPWNDTGGHGERVLEAMRIDNPTGKVSDDATMRLAMEKFESGDFEGAADTFADLRMTYPDSEHQFDAQFLELQSLLASYQGPRYSSIPITDAQKRVKQLARQFPEESAERNEEIQAAYAKIRFLMAERIWNQAQYRRDRSENSSAKFHFERILEEYADTPFAEQARVGLEAIADKPADPPQRFKALVWALGGTTDDRPWREGNNVPDM